MTPTTRTAKRSLLLAAVVAGGALSLAGPAFAGTCPAGKETTTNGQKAGATAHKDVKEELLGSIDLSKEKVNVPGRLFRMRRLEIAPGGEVAWHSHEDRPALIYVVTGTIVEYSSHCSVPIVHDTGDLSIEAAGLSHWWKNTTKKPVTLISADIAKDPNEKGM